MGSATEDAAKAEVVLEESAEIPPLDVVFRRYSAYVASIGMQILGRHDEVDDLVQDVFIEAHRGLHRLRNPAALKRWLATVTVHAARRRVRRHKLRRLLHLEDAPDYGALVDTSASSPEESAYLSSVYAALDELPANDRIIWVLRNVQGESLQDVVTITGLSQSTVQRSLRRAQAELQEKLGIGEGAP